jgi:hypothetical protein
LAGALDEVEVVSLLDREFPGLAKAREHWHAPVGDRRTKDRLTEGQRAYNRLQAGLRALWSSRSPTWQTPGRCAAGGGRCAESGTSSAPPGR